MFPDFEWVCKMNYKFSNHWSYNFREDPKRLAFVLSRYQFAAKMGARIVLFWN